MRPRHEGQKQALTHEWVAKHTFTRFLSSNLYPYTVIAIKYGLCDYVNAVNSWYQDKLNKSLNLGPQKPTLAPFFAGFFFDLNFEIDFQLLFVDQSMLLNVSHYCCCFLGYVHVDDIWDPTWFTHILQCNPVPNPIDWRLIDDHWRWMTIDGDR